MNESKLKHKGSLTLLRDLEQKRSRSQKKVAVEKILSRSIPIQDIEIVLEKFVSFS